MKITSIKLALCVLTILTLLPIVAFADINDDETFDQDTTAIEIQSVPDSVEANRSDVIGYQEKTFEWKGQPILKPDFDPQSSPIDDLNT